MSNVSECAFSFHEYTGSAFNVFSQGIQTGLNDNANIFDPLKTPVTNEVLVAEIGTMVSDYSLYKKGGLSQKQVYLTSKEKVMNSLNSLVPFVNKIANGDTKIIILAGFEPTYAVAPQKAGDVSAPVSVEVYNLETSGNMTAECETFGVGKFYGCIVSEGKPLDVSIIISGTGHIKFPAGSTNAILIDLSHQRIKKFVGFTSGINYWFYFYVVSTGGVSSLSKPVVKMCS